MLHRIPIADDCNLLHFEGVKALRRYNFGEAEKFFNKAQTCFEEKGFPPGIGRVLINLARIRRCQGEYQEALDFIHQALEVLHQIRGKTDLKNLAALYNDWGNICTKLGQHEKSKKHFLRSLELAKGHLSLLQSEQLDKTGTPSRAVEVMAARWECEAGMAITLLNLAQIALNEAYEQAAVEGSTSGEPLTQLELLSEPERWRVPQALIEKAKDIALKVYDEQNRPENQKQLKDAGIVVIHSDVYSPILGAALGQMADIKVDRAKVLWRLGKEEEGDKEFDHALSRALRSISFFEKGGAKSETYFAMKWLFQLKRHRELSKKWASEGITEMYPGCLTIPLEEVFKLAPPWLDLRNLDDKIENGKPLGIPAVEGWKTLQMGAFYWDECGYRDKQYKYLARAVEQIETMQKNVIIDEGLHVGPDLLVITDQLKRKFFRDEMADVFNSLIHLLLSPYRDATGRKDPVAEAFHYCERSKARAFLDLITAGDVVQQMSIQRKEISRGDLPDQLRGEVFAVEDIQQHLKEYAPNSAFIEYHLTHDGKLTIFTITEKSIEVSRITEYWRKVSGFDPSNIVCQDAVKLDDSLKLLLAIRQFCRSVGHAEIPDNSSIWDIKDIKQQVNAVKRFCRTSRGTHSSQLVPYGIPFESNINLVKEKAQWLYEMLIRPTEHVWKSNGECVVDRLIIVPSGILHHLPFCALFDKKREQFLAEQIPVVQVPSASILAKCFARRDQCKQTTSEPESYLAIANPRGNKENDWKNYRDIRGCEDTVMGVTPYFMGRPDSYIFDTQSTALNSSLRTRSFYGHTSLDENIRILQREQATESAFLDHHNRYTFVDIHSHGKYDPREPMNSRILFAGDNGEAVWLRGADIFRKIQFSPHLRLLTLGICFGGQTELETGEEPVGLLRAFFYSGARSILACRWALEDVATAELIGTFYQSLIENGQVKAPKDQALQEAQKHMIDEGRKGEVTDSELKGYLPTWEHPYYWAWTLFGDYAD